MDIVAECYFNKNEKKKKKQLACRWSISHIIRVIDFEQNRLTRNIMFRIALFGIIHYFIVDNSDNDI